MLSRYISMRVQQAALAALLTLVSGIMPMANAQSQPLSLFSQGDRHAPIALEDSLYTPEPFYSLPLFGSYTLPENICRQPGIQSIDMLIERAVELRHINPDEALKTAEQALALAQQTGDVSGQARSLYTIGWIHYAHDRLDLALGHLTRANQLFEDLGDRAGLAGAMNVMGYVHSRQGDIPQALRAQLQALDLYEQLGDEAGMAHISSCIGVIHRQQGNVTQALRYHRRAVRLYQGLDLPHELASSYNNLGSALLDAEAYDEALVHLHRTLQFVQKVDDRHLMATVSNNIGAAFHDSGRPEEALEYLLNALRLSEEISSDYMSAAISARLGRTYLALGHLDLALAYAQRSLALTLEINDTHLPLTVQKLLAQVYAAQGDFEKAYAHQELYLAVRDSLFGAEQAEIIARMETRHEMEGMEREIDVLQQQSQIQRLQTQQRQNVLLGGLGVLVLMTGFSINRYRIKQRANHLLTSRNEQIKGMLEEKELLIKEIHHRVKNNLQVLSSMLRLQTQSLESPAALEAMQNMQTRVSSMTLLHQELYGEYASTYVPMQGYVEKLSRHLLQAFNTEEGRVHCFVHAQDVQLNADTAMPLGLILNELISNALKHAFPDARNGIIRIHLNRSQEDGWYELAVSDNGVGCPADTVPEESGQDGLTLLQVMTHQLHGTLRRIDDGEGVAYSIRFKEKEERT